MDDSKLSVRLLRLSDRELKLIAGEATHQHYKGGLYRLIGPVRDSATGDVLRDAEDRVQFLYEHLWPHERGMWVRTDADWYEAVDTPSWHPCAGAAELIHRFRPIGQGWAR